MVASDVTTSTSTLITLVTLSLTTPTGSSVETLPKSSSSNNNDLLVGLASAGGFALLLAVIGLLFCLRHTRTKHRRRIEDMERRLNGLENQSRPPPARRTKRFSTATGTSLGSSWGAWRSKDVKNFQQLRTAGQETKGDSRKSFGHGWWSFSPAPRQHDHRHNVTPLQDITSPRAGNPPQPIDASENDMEPLMAPRLSAIVECPSPSTAPAPAPALTLALIPAPTLAPTLARLSLPTTTASHHESADPQSQSGGLCDHKEIDVTSERVRSRSGKYDSSSMDKEMAVSKETGLSKNTAERCTAPPPPPPSIPGKTHRRKPALAGAISVFPPGTLTNADALRSLSSRYRPFSVINEDPSAAPRRPVPPPPPTRKPIVNRHSRGYSHIRNQSVFSDDSRGSIENSVAGRVSVQSNHARSSSAQSNTIWPWDIHSPKVDYGSASDSLPRFKQHRSPTAVAEGFENRLQNLTTSELDVSTAARIEKTDPRAADIADSYRTLVEKGEKPQSVTKHNPRRKSGEIDSSYKVMRGSECELQPINVPLPTKNHTTLAPASPVSSRASSTRSSEGDPFDYGESSVRSNSSHTASTSYLRRPLSRPRAGTDPLLNAARPSSNASTISTRREARKTRERKPRSANGNSSDLNIVIPTPTLHYHPSTFGIPKMQSLPKCQYARQVEPIPEQDEPMRSAKPVFKHLNWNKSSKSHVGTSPSRSSELVLPSNAPLRSRSTIDNRKSRDKDEETYNILNGSPSGCQSSSRKKNSLMGASEKFLATDMSSNGIFFSRRSNSDSRRKKKNSLMGSSEEFPSYPDCSPKETPSVKIPREDDNCENPRVRELKKTRRSGLRSPLSPYSISEDEAFDTHSPKAYSPFSPKSASSAHRSSHTLGRSVSLKSLSSPVPSPCLSETTPSELDARETNRILLQSFPTLPSLPPSSVSSSQNPFASPNLSSTASLASEIESSPIATATPSVRQGFGPGPSLSLLEKWEKQGRSYITSQATIAEEEEGDRGIQTFARGKAPRNLSPALGSGEPKTSNGETNIYPPVENMRKKVKHTRWESRGEIAEIISSNALLQKPQIHPSSHQREVSKASTNTQTGSLTTSTTATTNPTTTSTFISKSPLKPLLKPSESAKMAEAVGMKKSIDKTNITGTENGSNSLGEVNGSNTSKKVFPRGPSPPRKRGPRVEEIGKILGGKGVGW